LKNGGSLVKSEVELGARLVMERGLGIREAARTVGCSHPSIRRALDPEPFAEYDRRYRAEHPEKVREYRRRSYRRRRLRAKARKAADELDRLAGALDRWNAPERWAFSFHCERAGRRVWIDPGDEPSGGLVKCVPPCNALHVPACRSRSRLPASPGKLATFTAGERQE
jgi:hypothetical protein